MKSFCHFDNRNSSESLISDGSACPDEKTQSTGFYRWHSSCRLGYWGATGKQKGLIYTQSIADEIISHFFVISKSPACNWQPEDETLLSGRILNNNRRYLGKQ
ncbi:hypothetical protein [Bacteroides hominis]|uniref:hypothetical protein n=1 Tax=Bacteroides hominis TaxID=2763023 RepID=UPI003D6A0776